MISHSCLGRHSLLHYYVLTVHLHPYNSLYKKSNQFLYFEIFYRFLIVGMLEKQGDEVQNSLLLSGSNSLSHP
jgi:hypothetical protein